MATDQLEPRQAAGISPAALISVTGMTTVTTTVYRRAVRRWIDWAGARGLSAESLALWISDLRSEGRGTASIRQSLAGCRAAILQAAESAMMPAKELGALKEALASIKAPRPAKPEIRVLTTAERTAVYKELRPNMAALARFLYATGARISEALWIRGSDIVLEQERARITLHGKGGKDRVVRIPLDLLREINTVWDSKPRVFLFQTAPGRPAHRVAVAARIHEAGLRALGRRVTPHDFRHSRATDLFAKTKNLKGVSEFLGHAGISTTATYYVQTGLTDEDLWKGEKL